MGKNCYFEEGNAHVLNKSIYLREHIVDNCSSGVNKNRGLGSSSPQIYQKISFLLGKHK